MAIAEYVNQVIFMTTDKQAEFLKTLGNKSQYIREAIKEKMERENDK